MDRENLKPINTEHGELHLYKDWDCEGAICMENDRTIDKYIEIGKSVPDYDKLGVFAAFSVEQMKEGKSKLIANGKLKEGEKIVRLFGGIFGTKEGIKSLLKFYDDKRKKAAEMCDPQEVYIYEYNNHEAMFSSDYEEQAYKIVVSIFGKERASKVKRF